MSNLDAGARAWTQRALTAERRAGAAERSLADLQIRFDECSMACKIYHEDYVHKSEMNKSEKALADLRTALQECRSLVVYFNAYTLQQSPRADEAFRVMDITRALLSASEQTAAPAAEGEGGTE